MDILQTTGIVIGLVSVISQTGVPSKFKPMIAVAIGVVLSVAYGLTVENAVNGVIAGLSAVGLWGGTSTMIKKQEVVESLEDKG